MFYACTLTRGISTVVNGGGEVNGVAHAMTAAVWSNHLVVIRMIGTTVGTHKPGRATSLGVVNPWNTGDRAGTFDQSGGATRDRFHGGVFGTDTPAIEAIITIELQTTGGTMVVVIAYTYIVHTGTMFAAGDAVGGVATVAVVAIRSIGGLGTTDQRIRWTGALTGEAVAQIGTIEGAAAFVVFVYTHTPTPNAMVIG